MSSHAERGDGLDKIKHASNHYRCRRCGKTFERLRPARDHSQSHSEADVDFVEVVDR